MLDYFLSPSAIRFLHNTDLQYFDQNFYFFFLDVSHQTEVEHDDDEQPKSSKKGRRKPAYAGGLVLEPKKGIYSILLVSVPYLLNFTPPAFILNLALWTRRLFDARSLVELFIHEAMVLLH